MCDTFIETDVFLFQSVLPNEPGCFTWARTTHSLWETIREVPEHLGRVQLQFGNISFSIFNIFLTNIVYFKDVKIMGQFPVAHFL